MNVTLATSMRSRLRGLLGYTSFPGALLLAPCNDVHTFGMRVPIDIAFVSEDGFVLEAHRGIGSRRRLRCKRAAATIERFADTAPWLEEGDRIQLTRQHERKEQT